MATGHFFDGQWCYIQRSQFSFSKSPSFVNAVRGLQRRNHFFLTVKFIGCISQIIPDSNKQQEKSSNPVAHSPNCLLSASEEKRKHPLKWVKLISSSQTDLQRLGFPSMFQSDYRQKSHTVVLFTKQLVCNLAEYSRNGKAKIKNDRPGDDATLQSV